MASRVTGVYDPDGWAAVQCDYRASGIRGVVVGQQFPRLGFVGLETVPPGVVLVSQWRPDSGVPRPTPAEVSVYGLAGRKP